MAEILLFSYGTLQDPTVQQANFDRRLKETADHLTGFVLGEIEITDPEVIAERGLTHYPVLRPGGDPADRIDGTVFRITEAELAAADLYEGGDYRRIEVPLGSGLTAWVYIAA